MHPSAVQGHTGFTGVGYRGAFGSSYGGRGYEKDGNEEPSVEPAVLHSMGQQTLPQPGDAAIPEIDPNTDRDRPSLLRLLVNALTEGGNRALVEAVFSLLERGAGRGTNRVELVTNKDVIAKEKETVGEEETIEDDGSSTKKEDVVREREFFGKEQVLQQQEQSPPFYIPPPGSSDAVVYSTLLRMTLLLLRDVFDLESDVSCDYLSRKECAGLVLIETIEKLIREGGPFQ